jgi:hypothetical protein
VSGTSALLQTESAAVQVVVTGEQMDNLPTSGRAFQTALTLMAGVAQPNYIQAGGINNPARSMAVSVNGFGVISSTQSIGREYDERYLRLGIRLSF